MLATVVMIVLPSTPGLDQPNQAANPATISRDTSMSNCGRRYLRTKYLSATASTIVDSPTPNARGFMWPLWIVIQMR